MARRKPRRPAQTLVLDWAPAMASVFEVAMRLGMTPPARVSVAVIKEPGVRRHPQRQTWSGDFRTSEGLPSRVVVRLRTDEAGDFGVVDEQLNFAFRTQPRAEEAA